VANSAFGNFCNYWIFVTLESTHRPVIGDPFVALLVGSVAAWAINFAGARLLLFGSLGRRVMERFRGRSVSRRSHHDGRAQAEPGSSRR
jgi:hypothetical protein